MNKKKRMKIENIIVDLDASTKEDVIIAISNLLKTNNYISDVEPFVKAVLDREGQFSTGIGNGISIPHGAEHSVNESTIAFAKLKNPMDWDSLDDQPVQHVFLLAINKDEHGEQHLRVLSELAKELINEDYVDGIKNANNREEIYTAINKGDI